MGCLKPHCPFMHTTPRPQTLDFRERMSNYKMAAITVKTLEQPQKEKGKETNTEEVEEQRKSLEEQRKKEKISEEQRKKEKDSEEQKKKEKIVEEQRKNVEEKVQRRKESAKEEERKKTTTSGKGEEIGALRKELLRRMLAEQKAFRERLSSQTSQGEEEERSKSTNSPPLRTNLSAKSRTGSAPLHGRRGNAVTRVKAQLGRTKMKENAERRNSLRKHQPRTRINQKVI